MIKYDIYYLSFIKLVCLTILFNYILFNFKVICKVYNMFLQKDDFFELSSFSYFILI